MKPGVYLTEYGNAAVVTTSKHRAFDLDMGEFIPLEQVTGKFIRKIESDDRVAMYYATREMRDWH